MHFLNNVKLRDKFLLIILSIFIFVFFLFSFVLIRFEEKQIIENTRLQGEYLVKTLAFTFIKALEGNNPAQDIKRAVSQTQNDKNIRNLILIDTNNTVLYRSGPLPASIKNSAQFTQTKELLKPTMIQFIYPLNNIEKSYGVVYLDYSLESAIAKLTYFKYFLIISAFLILVLAIFLSLILSRMVTRQVDLLHQTVQKVNNGNFSHKVQVTANDELGDLAKAFNLLFHTIKESNKNSYIKTKKLLAEKNMLHAILSNLYEGVIVTDPGMRIIEINTTAEDMFDIYSKLALGELVSTIIKNEIYIEHISAFTSDSEPAMSFSIQFAPDELSSSTYKVSLIRATNEFGEIIGIISVFNNITKEHKIDEMKTNLLQIVSHELRTPLVSIIGFLDILEKEGKSYIKEQHFEFIDLAKTSAENLKNLVNNLLSLSRLQSDQIEFTITKIALPSLIDEVVKTFHPQIEMKGLAINKKYHSESFFLECDHNMIRQVLFNLIGNAIKFTDSGSITLSTSQDEHNTSIEIADTGIGIPQKYIAEIFEKFKQVDLSFSRNYEGIGLGLSIVQEIITRLGGSIKVSSAEKKGSVFTISLPIKRNS
ncbi:MAG TPA: hypothetical protein DF296_00420 [Candidatus Margulisbacteria bacterium]|nr:MAG: hypothetical protein A2X41_04100 [Candidatus Margulisbacteria bacterium GWE2_39_32]HCT83647.1 hypothetical protein [Candidatus Margulisiibacteriota bacterium]